MHKKIACFLTLVIITCILINCRAGKPSGMTGKSDYSTVQGIGSTPLSTSAIQSLKNMVVEAGFKVELVASEPLVSAPVALNFDAKGRMWIVEMQSYMTDPEGSEEERPSGKIIILEDLDKDGIADKRNVFLDSLVLPRALCLIENGILIAEPPRLWYVEIVGDKPGKKTLIDAAYTEGGNVEAQANGLFRAMDNWIYSGGSEKRYRKKGNNWIIERTHLRGQWGITQDDHGRLYYNNNSQNLLGDYFTPGLGASNTNMQGVKGFNEKVVSDNKVYPVRPTPGVNRGYKENILDDSLRLKTFTAACGPVIYRGDLFDLGYYSNAFVAEPAANLIKRNILEQRGYTTTGKQAYEQKEFLTSTDERFRPVSLYNGPDGALYVVDMYRGIIQHKSFMTDYLKKEIHQRSLYQPLNCGRIYKIVPKNKRATPIVMPENPSQLVNLLKHPNGWVRDKAQQMLVDGKFLQVNADLQSLLKTERPITIFHSLWTMEGLGVLTAGDLLPLLKHADWKVRAQALSVLPSVMNQQTYQQYVPALQQLVQQTDSLIAPYLAFQIQGLKSLDKTLANNLLLTLSKKYADDPYVSDAILSNLKNTEAEFSKDLDGVTTRTSYINERFKKVIADINSNLKNKDINLLKKQYPRGVALYSSTCQPCHGSDGNGVQFLAPPLNKSEWVNGKKDKLISIILYGLTGPVKVNNKLYKAPEINGDMPGIGTNKELVDEDIAQLLSFIRNSWSNTAEKVTREEVIKIRQKYGGREKPFTTQELDKQ